MSNSRILITGSSGYIGGEVLAALLASKSSAVQAATISCMVRGEEKAEALKKLGVTPLLFNSLDETEILAEAASNHDIVIHAASGFHTLSARALVLGLAQRKRKTGKDVHYIHTSGTSNVADRPISMQYVESRYPLSDKDDIFAYMKTRDEDVPYAQRTSDIVITETGLEHGVKTYVLMSPSLYGIGVSPLHEFCHVPILIRAGLKLGKVPVVGAGSGIWDHAHIQDMACFYETVVTKILDGQDIPSGKDGIYFIESGEHTWREIAERVAEAGVALGALQTTELQTLDLQGSRDTLGGGWGLIAEIGWASK
ncbi:uncharacterized protein A1O5_04808 [Cladophialophora psammophila CBS 110553]|uniref:NAD-dependent epimerase/dehydratase domain-containing protein n=1 Tax=Cladophialophora psammophila CBS 110553 TaxID=1182543 RepID=W9XPP6_9EURO|nr:uncharacterized protein A1O5_04808 [Cladophialophora psammophila CBS 110553]EXJ72304.1 hypothetical protein A1O5_04808 [Cladophialophora psammophila CBS 110553]